jgi:hypothetical protein
VNRLKQVVLGIGVSFGLTTATSCSHPEPPSAIVQKAESAGAGDLGGSSESSMAQWLAKNPGVATDIEALCKPVRSSATASWAHTTEGRLCKASGRVAFFAPSQTKGDDRKFGAGNK